MTMKISNQAGVRSARKPLAGSFEAVFWRVASDPTGAHSRVLAILVSALLNGEEFEPSQIDRLPGSDRVLCVSLFNYCMTAGLTEDERAAAADAFLPFAELHQPGTRH